jgi:hypothetical protein
MTIRAHAVALLLILAVRGLSAQDVNILLLAGTMQPIDHVGHHDYRRMNTSWSMRRAWCSTAMGAASSRTSRIPSA